MLDTAFEALNKFDYGSDLAALNPLEDAIAAAQGKPDATRELETRILAALQGNLSRDAQEYLCRKLTAIGTAASVPRLAVLVANKDVAHMARFALERIPGPEATQALIDALPKATGNHKIGIISSLGGRRDSSALASLAKLLSDADIGIARAAAMALGSIGTAEAVAALKGTGANSMPVVDALLRCAESLLAVNKRTDAQAIYKLFAQEGQPRLVRLAATRGLLACSKQA